MAFEFRLPDIGEGVAEGEVVQWFVKEGDSIAEDAPLVSVLTDKANVEIPSPRAGRIARLHAQVGEKVKVGGLLVTIEEAPGASPRASPAAGPSPAHAVAAGARAPTPATTAAAATAGTSVAASPYLRRLALERGIDLSQIRGSGPGGRIVEADLAGATGVAAAGPVPTALAATPPPSASPAPPATPMPADLPDVAQRIPIRGMRRAISEHMTEASHRPAPFTYVEEIDVTELILLRDRMAKHIERDGVQLRYLPFIVKAVIAGLRAHPTLNATMDDARGELVVRSAYHIGIATAAPDGLIVPVVRNADQKSLAQLAREIQDLGERGRAGKLARAELTGSTFTITSLGALGGVLATPILNYPEVGILGVHKIRRRPIYRADGSLGPADLMNLSLTLDHRVLDGITGAEFLQTVRAGLEDPHQLFADMR
ncbi:MAG TPA: dihydrolipoamide acetyltransferase family protein [Thermoplasmata archaeon]|nr:dihydrolipoamide acetyltransferase family protein [Thermoplasmata archaeon]